jgi:hypothetical protein
MLLAEFDRGKEFLKLEFKTALSKIHINFNLWISLNKLIMLKVVTHYLLTNLIAKSPLIALRKLSENYNSENQIKILLKVAEEFNLANKEILRYFIVNNDVRNDVAIRIIVKKL